MIEQLCNYFWEHGYGATSLDKLAQQLGIKRGSLYNAFGSKEALFNAAFERYEENLYAAFDIPDYGIHAIAHYFDNLFKAATTQGIGRGCFFVNLLMSAEIPTSDLQQAVERDTAFIKRFLSDHLTRAFSKGYLQPTVSVQSGIDVLFGAVIGIFALARTRATPSMIQAFINNTFRGLFSNQALMQIEYSNVQATE
ncbi:MAG: TetR/AcrR family transcriptional regulator [Cyanobacteria bacterium P01_G01_bin.38]